MNAALHPGPARQAAPATPEKLMRDVRSLISEAEELIRSTAGDIEDRTRGARARLAGALGVAKETCDRLEDQLRARAVKADHFLRGRPYQAMAVSLLLGVAVGMGICRLSGRQR